MKKNIHIILSFIMGAIVALLVTYYGYFQYCKSNWNKQGFNRGYTKAQFDIYKKIKDEFGEVDHNNKDVKSLFVVKDATVVIVKEGEVKSVRVE
jgi:hypothetical protein